MIISDDSEDEDERYMSLSGGDGLYMGTLADADSPNYKSDLAFLSEQGAMKSASDKVESHVFEESESLAWKSHHLKRFTNDNRDKVCCSITSSRRSTVYKWILVIVVGVVVALIGLSVTYLTQLLSSFKYSYMQQQLTQGYSFWGYAYLVLITVAYSTVAGLLCWFEPNAAGSGIAQIKAYLNGVNLHKVVRIRTLFAKVVGMVFSVSSGLPLGKEGPMIHAGSIVGAAVSQGKSVLLGYVSPSPSLHLLWLGLHFSLSLSLSLTHSHTHTHTHIHTHTH